MKLKYEVKIVFEVKANAQPIGNFDFPEPFTSHSFDLHKGDSIYIYLQMDFTINLVVKKEINLSLICLKENWFLFMIWKWMNRKII
jgi:hypothetical protein